MTDDDRSLERAARSWLELGPTRAPDHAVDAALARIQTTRQERDLRIPWRLPRMNPLLRLATLAVVATIAIGGSLYFLGGPGDVGPQPTASPSAAPSPSTLPAPTASPGTGACSLVTSKEAETLAGNIGLGALASETGTGNVTTCNYRDGGGNLVLRLVYTKSGGAADFDQVKSTAGAQVVTGIGDDAVFDPEADALHVLNGDAVLAIFASAWGQNPADRLALASAIAEVAVERM